MTPSTAPVSRPAETAPQAPVEERLRRDPAAHRLLSGDRPTGPLHVGHYFGTLRTRVRLQDLGVDTYVLIADYQVLTDRDRPGDLPALVEELLLDHLATGLDPERTTVFTHSAVTALNQLMLPLLSLVSVAELGRNPTVKDEIAHSRQSAVSGLMFTYPVHQAADILFCKADVVPVGRDQLPHLELTRTLARRFNERYTPGTPGLFRLPEPLLSDAPLLLGTDGQKMSKSRGNAVPLAASADETARLIRAARTDADRRITYDPAARPGVASLLALTALCEGTTPETVAEEVGDGGAAVLKRRATEAVNTHLAPLRARRAAYAADRGALRAILRRGNERAAARAERTLAQVRAAMGTDYR